MAEGICRIVLDSVDYLKPYKVRDPILGHKLKPNSGGHDAWGYRNKFVPSTADIVTIGDSQTYGLNATVKNSWPGVLQQLTGRDVYNLSLGGYGPIQYLYLLESKALTLHPSLVIVGFYFGNDLRESVGIVYKQNYWKHLRKPGFILAQENLSRTEIDPDTENDAQPKQGGIKRTKGFYRKLVYGNWFAHHSILYRLVNNSSIGEIFRFTEANYGYAHENITIFKDTEHNIRTGFIPIERLSAVNMNDSVVQEGLRISLKAFQKIHEIIMSKNVDLLVVLIPTKESVFAKYIEKNRALHNSEIIDELLINEDKVRESVKEYFEEHNIAYVDVLYALRNSVGEEEIYPQNSNGHPNKNGYRIIAETVQQYLNSLPTGG
jgi:lysophospholipase L1-like esterase